MQSGESFQIIYVRKTIQDNVDASFKYLIYFN